MATNLRRMVVLGPSGTINLGGSHDYRNASNRVFFSDTGTRWARFWADWPTLEPNAGQLDTARLAALDAQIARAKRDGLKVISPCTASRHGRTGPRPSPPSSSRRRCPTARPRPTPTRRPRAC
jgi:hypothetical protein